MLRHPGEFRYRIGLQRERVARLVAQGLSAWGGTTNRRNCCVSATTERIMPQPASVRRSAVRHARQVLMPLRIIGCRGRTAVAQTRL
jgi:hypothetical protein